MVIMYVMTLTVSPAIFYNPFQNGTGLLKSAEQLADARMLEYLHHAGLRKKMLPPELIVYNSSFINTLWNKSERKHFYSHQRNKS